MQRGSLKMNDNSRLREWWSVDLDVVWRAWRWFLVLGILLMILGALALAASALMTLGTMVFFGFLLLIGGVIQLIHAFKARGWGGLFLLLLTGILGVVTGGLMVRHPGAAALSLTLLLASFFMVGGLFRVVGSLLLRFPNWGWACLSGVIAFLLGVMLVMEWPASGLWFIGIYIGITLIFEGWGWVMVALAARRRKVMT
jgi:uncharacterized membrane protein HdeD (DUF308 family)